MRVGGLVVLVDEEVKDDATRTDQLDPVARGPYPPNVSLVRYRWQKRKDALVMLKHLEDALNKAAKAKIPL